MRILLIGPLPPPLGGVRILFQILKEDLEPKSDVAAVVVNLSGIRFDEKGSPVPFFPKGIVRFLAAIRKIIAESRNADILTLHHNMYSMPWMGPLLILLGKLRKKAVFLRNIGGNDIRDLPKLQFALLKWSLRKADFATVETKHVLGIVESLGISGVEWLANSRPMPPGDQIPTYARNSCRRFVYIGHVRRTKGLPEIIEAGERFADREDVAVDVYGSLRHELSEKDFEGLKKVRFRGGVPFEDLPKVLSEYDALLLPSYHEGEGYPGIVFDAYAVGMPVICTNWQALPEIVDDTSGRLIEPHNADALYRAMNELMDNDETFAKLRQGVLKKRTEFDSQMWNERFVEMCRGLI